MNNTTSSKRHQIINSVLISLLSLFILVVSIAGGEIDYPGNDDTFRNLISAGAFGDKYAYYLTFSNVLYGVPIRLLNMLVPAVNWYYLVMIIFSVVSIASICILTMSDKPYHISLLGTTILNMILARDYYTSIQYTKTGFLWIICGFALLGAGLARHKSYWISGLILALLGLGSRIECLELAIPFMILFLLFSYPWKKETVLDLKYHSKRIVIIILCFVIPLACEYFFCRSTEWGAFMDFTEKRVYIHDHSQVNYAQCAEEFEAMGLSENDFNLLLSWEYGDTDFYTTECLDKICRIMRAHESLSLQLNTQIIAKTFDNILKVFKRVPQGSWGVPILTLILILYVLILGNNKSRLYALLNLMGILGCYWYFTCTNRFMWRAEIGCWIIIIICMMTYIHFKHPLNTTNILTGRILLAIAAITLACYTALMAYNFRYVKDKNIVNNEADITGLLTKLNSDNDNFYFLTDFYVTNNPMSITASRYKGLYNNCCYMGNWIIPSSHGLYYLNSKGMTNPMRSLVDFDNTYLVTSSENLADSIRVHLSEVYGQEISVTQISDGIWKYSK